MITPYIEAERLDCDARDVEVVEEQRMTIDSQVKLQITASEAILSPAKSWLSLLLATADADYN